MGYNWTPAAISKLTELAAKSDSVRKIADAFGVTRNTIIGKAWRMGIPLPVGRSGPKPGPNFVPRKRNRGTGLSFRSKNRKPPQLVAVVPRPDSLNIPFGELRRGHCRYPVTDGPPHFFCGNPQVSGSSYCAHHRGVCHV